MKEKRETHNSTSEEETLHCLMGPLEIGKTNMKCFNYLKFKSDFMTKRLFLCILLGDLKKKKYLVFSGAESKPSIEYFYLKTKDLTYFQYACSQIDYSQWMEKDKHTITMHMDIIIKIGVVGKFTNHNLKFLPEGNVVDFIKGMFYDYYDKNIQ